MARRIDVEIFPKVQTAGETVIPLAPISVRTYSWNVRGGPDTAQLEMTGDPKLTWDALNWLRCPVMLRDEMGTPVWWGFIESVDVGVGVMNIGARIDTLANRIAVAYTEAGGAASIRGTTPWAEDSYSIMTFGTKELLLSQSDLNAQTAAAYRDAQLAIRKIPQATVRPSFGTKTVARIMCRGWYPTIGWKYFARSQGRYAYLPSAGTSSSSFAFGVPASGATPAYLKVAQQFQVDSGGWSVATVKMQIRKVGTPTEGVRLSLWTNHVTNGVPQTELKVATVPDSAIGSSGGDWITFTISPSWTVDPLNVFWIVLEKNGGVPDANNYYTVQGASAVVTPPGYPIYWNGSAWVGLTGTLSFVMEGTEETHVQMGAIIAANSQFLTGYIVTDSNFLATVGSGVFSNPYRSGDTNALTELESLLDVGNSASQRYLATVNPNGFLTVYPEPFQGLQDWTIDERGSLYDGQGVAVDPSTCPVGYWVSLSGLLPKSTNIQALTVPPAFFIESSTYNAVTGSLDLTPRGAAGLDDIGRIRQG